MKKLLLILICIPFLLNAQEPRPSSGKLETLKDFPSAFIEKRTIYVWLPEGYSSGKKYPVLYMHDGQMLFDSTTTWNKQEWMLDETLGRLIQEKKVPPCIVVGIPSIGAIRHAEYFPQQPLQYMPDSLRKELVSKALNNDPRADRYLKFLVQELKPYIDSHYTTAPSRNTTFIAGSSMGGLISLYAICEYPDVFGGAACLSTHWPGIFTQNDWIPGAFLTYLDQKLPDPATHRIYFDLGDATLDQLYPPHQVKVDALMQKKGYGKKSWATHQFPGDDHSERAWARRLHFPLQFLLHP